MRQLMTFLGFLLLLPVCSEAQIFNKIKKRAEQQLIQKVEDRVVEEVSAAIVRAAYKPIDKAFDNMVKDYYGADTLENGEVDWEKVNKKYEGMMASFDASDRLPASYTFDLYMDVVTTDYEGQQSEVRMFYRNGKEIFGIAQDQENTENLVVIDIENDLIAMFTEEDGKQVVQAVPNMLKMAAAFADTEAVEEEIGELRLEKTSGTRNIAGYYTEAYEGENKEEYIKAYVAPEFPVDWRETYGGFIEQYTPESYSNAVNEIEGMIMYSENSLKEDKKKKTTWEVKKVYEKEYLIDVGQYEKRSYSSGQ